MRKKGFLKDEAGVEGLPVRLIVVLVIGVIALAAMVSALNGFKPQKTLSASIIEVSGKQGNMLIVDKAGFGKVNKTWTCKVKVTDAAGDPIEGASVIVYGMGGAGSDMTNKTGQAYLIKTNDIVLNPNQNSGYMTLEVSAPGYITYKNENALVVVRAD
ncbi:carboxypeptidase-like regulatory domain-containing protein [Methanocella arvoryzae]|uniref:Archaeal Type IV pilin N-terminal domain-containing protein n=1 Tax=Methanocella arvoryzae (strain DSM 22066 / NBRC 105507 / MRE50) TaxID=351160 RepID=Q0W5P9_METAR|nr:carboxypeptidase-like regulatory domain-containing protein [Methanocella arvoryzae]CAJ36294.1 conserved hypothetical protein [Methanocella arvoryzae MRE50]